ncbi:putative membrane protein [Xanthomonas translucens pv. arrhenatheri LMG 727]|uniref:Putative membrane protein n=1 Tax=Xanthomonas graminis pv. arrhenatheri LMG 727 TaxID=1195923 RepID=A0A0K2ZXK6_9XANT|nr:putative membrane protein [Xanthomonas translucens pv. arrhenatheri LMG 727]
MPFAVSRKTWLLLAPAALLLGVVGYRALLLLAAAPVLPPVAAGAAATPVAMDVPDQDQRRRSSVQAVPATSPERRAALERSPDLYSTA